MATRYISTKVAVEGESEYRQAISTINTEIKALNSELKLVESEFQNHQNSLEALTRKSEVLGEIQKTLTEKIDLMRQGYDGCKRAMEEYAAQKDRLGAALQQNKDKLEALKNTAGDTSAEQKKLTEEQKKLVDELDKADQKFQAAQKGANSWTTQINQAQIQLNNFNAAAERNSQYLNEARNSADGCAKSIDEFGNKVDTSKKAVDELAEVLAAKELAKLFQDIEKELQKCTTAASNFESGMASVRRTVGGSDAYIRDLAENFKDLSTVVPITQEELTSIAALAGQLGIAQEDVKSFTEVMARLGTATDLTAESAATLLAQFANVTGTKDYDRLGSTVAALGDSTATTATKIVEMSQRMAAAGTIAGLSEKDILAIAAAVGSLGVESNAGGTAMQTLITNIFKAVQTGDKLEDFASAAGMSAKEFARAWREDPIHAFEAFINGLSDVERNGKSTIEMLDKLGINNQRQITAVAGLATAEGLLSKTVEIANKAWDANSALIEKSEVMYGTTEAKLTMMKNSFGNLQIAIGNQLNPALAGLYEIGNKFAEGLTRIVENLPLLVPMLAGLVVTFTGYTSAVSIIATVTKLWAAANSVLSISLSGLQLAGIIGGVGLLVGAIAGVVAVINNASSTVDELAEASINAGKEIRQSNSAFSITAAEIDNQADSAQDYIAILQSLEGQLDGNAEAQAQYAFAVGKLNEMFPDLRLEIDATTGRLKTSYEEISNYVERWRLAQKKLAEKQDAETVLEQSEIMQSNLEDLERQYQDVTNTIDLYDKELELLSQRYQDGEIDQTAYIQRTTDLNQKIKELTDKLNGLAPEIKKVKKEIEENSEEVEHAKDVLGDLSDANEDVADSFVTMEEATETAIEEVSDRITALAKSYKEAKDSAEKSVEKQIGLWEDFSEVGVTSIDKLQKAVSSQITYLENYNTNLENLRARNIEGIDEFSKRFTDGTTESAAALAGLATASDEEIEKLIASLGKVDEQKGRMIDNIVEVESSYSTGLEQIIADYEEAVRQMTGETENIDFAPLIFAIEQGFADAGVEIHLAGEGAGENATEGFVEGVESGQGEVENSARTIADAFTSLLKSLLRIHSPSGVTREIGENTAEGFNIGLKERLKDVPATIEWLNGILVSLLNRTANQAVEAFSRRFATVSSKSADILDKAKNIIKSWSVTKEISQTANQAVNAFAARFEALKAKTRSIIDSIKGIINGNKSSMYSAGESLGSNLGSGLVAGMNNAAGRIASRAKSMVQSALNAAYRAAEVNSPSKATMRLGEAMGEGVTVGLDKKENEVVTKSKHLIEAAVSFDSASLKRKISTSMSDMSTTFERVQTVNNTVNHTGVIRVEGVNDRNQLESVIDIVVNNMRREARL